MRDLLLILLIILGLRDPVEAGRRCFECQDLPKPYDCDTVVECNNGDMCNADTRRNRDVIRASTDVNTCEECCNSNHCNLQGCHQYAPPRNTRGPYCYSCHIQSGEDRCRTVKQCAIDQACWVKNVTSPMGMLSFQTGCISATQCHAMQSAFFPNTNLTSGISAIDQCPFCCGEDFCNDNCNHNVSIATTATPIDGQWTDWSVWSTCSRTCGAGEKTRTRWCNNPAPQHNGMSCVGDNLDFTACSVAACTVDGQWSNWSAWSSCSVTCDQGSVSRTRSCSQPSPENGGKTCAGNTTDAQVCTRTNCPVDGHWSDWLAWTSCTTTCGPGIRKRRRTCDNPAPQNGGKRCTGSHAYIVSCNVHNPCPVDGNWSEWSSWTPCDVTCSSGSSTRNRSCDHPAPQHGGLSCIGHNTVTSHCSTGTRCPVNGHWSEWSAWSSCKVTCGFGATSRNRSCNNPTPQFNGSHCHGSSIIIKQCDTYVPCPVDGGWSVWSGWSLCSASCGNGTHAKIRGCNNQRPEHGGSTCPGSNTSVHECFNSPCQMYDCQSGFQYDDIIGCFKFNNEAVNFGTARANCHDLDAELLTIHNQQTEDHVTNLLEHANNDGDLEIWLGLRWIKDQHVWKWDDHSHLAPSGFNNFDYHKWYLGSNSTSCAKKRPDAWHMAHCTYHFNYICVARNGKPTLIG